MENSLLKDFKGVWIPPHLLHNHSISTDLKYYLSLCIQYDYNLSIVEPIMEMMYSKPQIIRCKRKAKKLGLINVPINPIEAKERTLNLIGEGKTCEWCGNRCVTLHEHHYPIPKHKGGTETVKICPNCHYTYHYILNIYGETTDETN